MKTIFLNVLILVVSVFVTSANAQDKIALIVAIGDYPEGSGWMKINSGNDIPLIKHALLKQGFDESNIHLLENEAATREGILRAIKNDLIANAKSGGVAFFHYSGHGQQIADNNADEFDGYDEALVPYDSPLEYIDGVYEGENLLRDEELGGLLDQVRNKLGPSGNLLTVIDACHSGTGTRGMAPARGTDKKMAPKDYKVAHRGSSAAHDKNAMESTHDDNLAPMVAFFGAAPHQLNFETKDENGKGVGSLSYAFSKKFAEAGKNTTYQRLFDKIKLEMSSTAPRQQPQAEGVLNQEIMGGKIVGKTEYFRPTKFDEDEMTITIAGGFLHGINEGTVIGFYSGETMEHGSKEPMFKGTAGRCNAIESVVFLENDIDKNTALGSWGIVLEKSYGSLKVPIHLSLQSEGHVNAFQQKIAEMPILEETEEADLFVVEENGRIKLITRDDYVLEDVTNKMPSRSVVGTFEKKIKGYAQAKFLRNLEVSSHSIPLEFEFLPMEIEKVSKEKIRDIPLSERTDENGNIKFKVGDGIKLKIHNWGNKTAYFTLLDIQPDNQINILIPDIRDKPADFTIEPGETKIIEKAFEIFPPGGTEVFKLIATDEAIDLRPIIASRGQGTKNVTKNPFEKLFAETHVNDAVMTRGGRTISIGSSKVNVFSQVFIIEE